jgi:hypothetical protein
MTGLKLQIMTENNTPWEPTTNTSLVVKADWNKSSSQESKKKKVKGKKAKQVIENLETCLDLPDITVCTHLFSWSPSSISVSVCLSLSLSHSLSL